MSSAYSDLEEGEIVDDLPSPSSPPKNKKLPRRYTLKDSKSKHKKYCKHSNHQQATKLMKTPYRNKSRPSSSHVRSGAKPKSNIHSSTVSFKSYDSSRHSPLSLKRKSPNLDTIKLKSILDLSKLKSISSSKSDTVKKIEACGFSEISAMYEAVRSETAKVAEPKHSDREVVAKNDKIKDTNNPEKEESEDEEELRRIALSTCMRAAPLVSNDTVSSCPADVGPLVANNFEVVDLGPNEPSSTPTLANPLVAGHLGIGLSTDGITSSETSVNPSIVDNYEVIDLDDEYVSSVPTSFNPSVVDNYEVVDMELDDDNDGGKSYNTDDLFVIDTKPSFGNENNSDSAAEKQSVVSDDDFEVDILRAELIENMSRQSSTSCDLKDHSLNVKVKNAERAILRTNAKSLVQKSKRPPTSITKGKVTKTQKRLIITLNAESSDDSDDPNGDSENVFPENPVASIEALISDIRQKSDSNCKSESYNKEVPKAVSCLSKAQQEEYNALMKILEKKKQDITASHIQEEESKNKTVHSPMNDLKVMEKKLVGVSGLLKKKKDKLKELLQDVAKHKQMYMKSKLTAQLLKEQFLAAEKVRRLKLEAWSNCCKKYEVAKKTVSDLESKTENLRNLCSRVGSNIDGQSYNLPADSA